ncbi:LacI family DNA-binding transcriptional regulator [Actinoplanes couchii]|uniref:LacI family transcriptional regulator n=1 Tax=Actinoplanes couchii TaxID=403638 RepID=A0ABQ3X848_9ACTN|nr:LacI family DNA-binding transcriptional regulator [Actinoplanes couchii]MDR6320301.1 LacI family transcriptional regulator [Actinoplanes couchii]GID54684.1 LacI family transcriptional regulator [Actinoplanes couchii]
MTTRRAATPRVTLVDVAKLATVDKAIVSRVINEDPALVIRQETRDRVIDAIRTLGYRPNIAARSLRTAKAGTLGLVIPDFANPVYAEIITGAESAALDRGHVLVTGSTSGSRNGMDRYLELLGQGRVDGLLLAGPTSAREHQKLQSLGLPWMMVNRRDTGDHHRYVILDDAHAAKLAVEHLLSLGHRRIGHVAGPTGADTAKRRAAGYRQAMKTAGITVRPADVARGDYTSGGGAEAMGSLLANAEKSGTPTAVFVANVAMAVGVLDTLRRAGLRVPADVSVVAVHDLPLAEHLNPPLTTVRMPLQQLGGRAVELLLSRAPEEQVTEVVSTATELVLRESTAPPRI